MLKLWIMPVGRLVMWIILYVVVMAAVQTAFQFLAGILKIKK